MSKAWQGKSPADMSDGELREAKATVGPALKEAQERLNWLSAANTILDYEVITRFNVEGMTTSVASPSQLPAWPADQVAAFKPTE